MAAAAAAAAAAVSVSGFTSASGVRAVQGPRAHLASARPAQQAALPRLLAVSSFLGTGVDRAGSRVSNVAVDASPLPTYAEVAVDGTPNSAATKLEAPLVLDEEPATSEPPISAPALEATVSAFMTDVANLVKLVDSRDIVELELKHKDYELLIRKKEALPPPPAPPQMSFPGPHVMAHTSFPGFAPPPPPPAPADLAPTPAAPVAPPAAEHPPMLSPMAGTFYRSPAPGESAFVKVGDKITKGQVLCIVEAMKLMNEIEADQSGTILDILAEDGKPVSIETPLFVIKP